MVNCRMGMGVGHREPSQTMGCLNFINIQTTAVAIRATLFTLRVVNCNRIKGLSFGCSRFMLTPVNPRCFVYCHCYAVINFTSEIFNIHIIFSYSVQLYLAPRHQKQQILQVKYNLLVQLN